MWINLKELRQSWYKTSKNSKLKILFFYVLLFLLWLTLTTPLRLYVLWTHCTFSQVFHRLYKKHILRFEIQMNFSIRFLGGDVVKHHASWRADIYVQTCKIIPKQCMFDLNIEGWIYILWLWIFVHIERMRWDENRGGSYCLGWIIFDT